MIAVDASLSNPVAALTQMFSNDFMRNAFMAGTVVSVLGGLVGYFVVLRRLTFAGEALSHVAFAAALAGVLLGIDALLGLFAITAVVAVGIGALGERARARDEAVGTVLAWVLGLGALLLSIYTSRSGGTNGAIGVSVLFGSIFGIQAQQAVEALVVGGAAAGVLLLIARPLLFASLDPDVAVARGTPVRALGIVFLVLVAVTVAEAVQLVGALLSLALLVLPAATAQRLTARPYRAVLLSATLAIAVTWVGLTLGYYTPYPVSFLITTLAFGVYVAVYAAGSFRGRAFSH